MNKVLNWGIFVLVLLGVYVFAGPTSLGGPASYVIVDGSSMEPTYEDGDLVITYERARYDLGDVIVYDAPVDAQFNVIHRITERTESGFITQGDNRDEVDGWIAPDDEIYGASLFHIPKGGAIVNFLRQPTTILAIGAGWVTLILMERTPKRSDQGRCGSGGFTDQQKPRQTPQHRRRRSNKLVSTIDAEPNAPRMSRTAKKSAERTAARKKRSTVATLSLAVLIGGSGASFLAFAASFSVDAGELQTFTEQVKIEPPPVEEHLITVQAHFFDQGSGEELGRSPVTLDPVVVMAGQSYQVTWTGPGKSEVVDCLGDDISFRDGPPFEGTPTGDGVITPTGDTTHVLCVRTAPGNVPENILVTILDDTPMNVQLEGTDGDEPPCDEAATGEDCSEAPADEIADPEEDLVDSDPDGDAGDEDHKEHLGGDPDEGHDETDDGNIDNDDDIGEEIDGPDGDSDTEEHDRDEDD